MSRPSQFSVYASRFINAGQAVKGSLYKESDDTEPLFFSVAEGSHLGLSKDSAHLAHGRDPTDLNDDGYPRLDGSQGRVIHRPPSASPEPGPSSSRTRARKPSDDPYRSEEELEYEEEDPFPGLAMADSIPMIASPPRIRSPRPPPAPVATAAAGWLAHFPHSKTPSPMPAIVRSPSSPRSSESLSASSRRTSESSEPPPFLDRQYTPQPPTASPLQDSLLPRDGVTRTLFNLPDPHRVPRRKYHDHVWTSVWCTSLLACAVGSIIILFIRVSPSKPSIPSKHPTPYYTVLRSVPFLMTIVIFSSAVSYAHLILLRYAVRPVLMATGLAIPLSLFIAAAWSFAGSFSFDEPSPSWGETVGLRLFSLIPLALCVLSARSLYFRRDALLRTVAVVELASTVVLDHPPILALSLSLLFGALVASLPFLSLILRLTLIGYYSQRKSDEDWHVRGYAGWLALLVTIVWVWSWGVVRGALKVSVSGLVGQWYFNRSDAVPAVTVTKFAFARAYGASLGSICIGTMLLAITRSLILFLRFLRILTTPPQMSFLALLHPLEWTANGIALLESLSSYTLVYVGLTGDPFWPATRKAKELVSGGGPAGARSVPRVRPREYQLLSLLLLLSSSSISIVTAIAGYLLAAHSNSGTTNALLTGMLAGGVTFMTITFGVGVTEDASDALFLCYRLDVKANAKHCPEATEAFEGRTRAPNSSVV